MQCYRVAPDKEASRWMITMGSKDLNALYHYKDEAVAEAVMLAKANSPCKIEICDETHEVVDKRKY